MTLQHALTQRFTCEFSIRVFIDAEPERTLARLREWTRDPVRTSGASSRKAPGLGSRGLRGSGGSWTIRRPWSSSSSCSRTTPRRCVRRSVANNLNDIGKDHPDVLVEVCRRWLVDATEERRALVRHALRSAVRRGEPEALEVLGFGNAPSLAISDVRIEPNVATIGDRVRLACLVENTSAGAAAWNVDLRIHFVKANGSTSPKVFKLRTFELEPGEARSLMKWISLAQHSTRKHHPGLHVAELVVNGATQPLGSFTVVAG